MKLSCLSMARPLAFGAFSLRRFRPTVHLCPPLVLLGCLIASTAAPAVGNHGNDNLGVLEELRELLVPGFGPAPEFLFGAGVLGLSNPLTGMTVPPFQYGVVPPGVSLDGFVVPSGAFLVRSIAAGGGNGFRLTHPLSLRWSGTASTAAALLTWQAGTFFDNVFNGASGGFIPFQIVFPGSAESGGAPPSASFLPIAAVPAQENPPLTLRTPEQKTPDVFEDALLPPPPGGPSEAPTEDGGQGPAGPAQGGGPATVPGPLPLAGLAIAWRSSRRLRQRVRQKGSIGSKAVS